MIREHLSRRSLTPANLLVGSGILLLALTGCGAESGGTSPTAPEPSASASAEPAADSQLTVVVTAGDGVEPITYELACTNGEPVGESELEDPAAACEVLMAHGDVIMAEPDANVMCTQMYGGPETAVVTGIVDGDEVNATFSRQNGCEIDRWAMFEPVLGTPGGTGTL
ncbi:hypothetical protein [Arthrobacter sp. H20]|uniref:hypothetical protein n=1 Tax=Arthrobacter sp. H20 TaxID=1267981 RepID=UPI0004B9F289|nr:hypothetical protein [Arthrobacter sp. H20]